MADQMYLNPEGTTVQDPNETRFFSKRERQLNIDMILAGMSNTDMDFETMFYANVDFFHSVFMNAIAAKASSEEELNQSVARITRTANQILDVLEKNPHSTSAEDMSAMMVVCLDLIDHMLKQSRGTR